jgi:hypothetical protein
MVGYGEDEIKESLRSRKGKTNRVKPRMAGTKSSRGDEPGELCDN